MPWSHRDRQHTNAKYENANQHRTECTHAAISQRSKHRYRLKRYTPLQAIVRGHLGGGGRIFDVKSNTVKDQIPRSSVTSGNPAHPWAICTSSRPVTNLIGFSVVRTSIWSRVTYTRSLPKSLASDRNSTTIEICIVTGLRSVPVISHVGHVSATWHRWIVSQTGNRYASYLLCSPSSVD